MHLKYSYILATYQFTTVSESFSFPSLSSLCAEIAKRFCAGGVLTLALTPDSPGDGILSLRFSPHPSAGKA